MASQWHYSVDGVRHGPISSQQLKDLAAQGKVARNDMVWKEGMKEWVPVDSLKRLFDVPSPLLPQPAMTPTHPSPDVVHSPAQLAQVATKSTHKEASVAARAWEYARSIWCKVQRAGAYAAKQAERRKLTTLTLTKAYAALGKEVYKSGRFTNDFSDEFHAIGQVDNEIAAHSSATQIAGTVQGLHDAIEASSVAAANARKRKIAEDELARLFNKLGKTAFERHGDQAGDPQLCLPIAQTLARVSILDEELLSLSESSKARVVTPKRLAIGGGCVMLIATIALMNLLGGTNSNLSSSGTPAPISHFDHSKGPNGEVLANKPPVDVGTAKLKAGNAPPTSWAITYPDIALQPELYVNQTVLLDGKLLSADFERISVSVNSGGEIVEVICKWLDKPEQISLMKTAAAMSSGISRQIQIVGRVRVFSNNPNSYYLDAEAWTLGGNPSKLYGELSRDHGKITGTLGKFRMPLARPQFTPLFKIEPTELNGWLVWVIPNTNVMIVGVRLSEYQLELKYRKDKVGTEGLLQVITLLPELVDLLAVYTGAEKEGQAERFWAKSKLENGIFHVTIGIVGMNEVSAIPPANSKLPDARLPDLQPTPVPSPVRPLRADKDKTMTLELGDGVNMELVRIESDEFLMGSSVNEWKRDNDETQHKVKIAKAFYMGIYEVTQGQYKAITGQSPSRFKGRDDLPVETVSWEDAVVFCQKLSKKTGRKVRLPTEAEWEYACRAGTTTPFHFGNTISTDAANYNGNATYGGGVNTRGQVYREKTIPVGSLNKPNAWALHDMHGNVWEWCSSKSANYPYRADDGREEVGGTVGRVLRGGGWGNIPEACRSAYRRGGSPNYGDSNGGFRVVLDF